MCKFFLAKTNQIFLAFWASFLKSTLSTNSEALLSSQLLCSELLVYKSFTKKILRTRPIIE